MFVFPNPTLLWIGTCSYIALVGKIFFSQGSYMYMYYSIKTTIKEVKYFDLKIKHKSCLRMAIKLHLGRTNLYEKIRLSTDGQTVIYNVWHWVNIHCIFGVLLLYTVHLYMYISTYIFVFYKSKCLSIVHCSLGFVILPSFMPFGINLYEKMKTNIILIFR